MFARNGFNHQTLNRIIQAVIGVLPIIHETAAQNIQGGSPGEHYHLTEEEHAAVAALQGGALKLYEPVMDGTTGELAVTVDGDCLMAWGGEYVA
jgi:hypothetical protein